MSRALVRRKQTYAERQRAQRQYARVNAPKLGQYMPAARQVCVDLSFDDQSWLSHAHRQFTTFPPAQAHFVYACPFGDCDGVYDLNVAIFGMLDSHSSRTMGLLQCVGHRARSHDLGAACGLKASYSVSVGYVAATTSVG